MNRKKQIFFNINLLLHYKCLYCFDQFNVSLLNKDLFKKNVPTPDFEYIQVLVILLEYHQKVDLKVDLFH